MALPACADGNAGKTPSFAAPTLTQLLESTSHIGASHHDLSPDPLLGLRADPLSAFSLPLALRAGKDGGLSFLYYAPPALVAGPNHGKPTLNTQPSTYGFSNALAFGGGNAVHLNGLMYLDGGQAAGSGRKTSQIISQALAYAGGAWKIDAHYQNVGKDFNSFDTVRGASPSLGLVSGLTTDTLAQLEKMRGKTDLGFGAHYATPHENFGFSFQDVADELGKLRTQQESLSFGKAFAGGLQLDAARDIVSTHPLDGNTAQALTTTTDHLRLGYDPGKGTSLVADARLVGDSQGRSERTLSLDMARRAKNLTLQASFLQFSPTPGRGEAQTTEHLQLAWQASPALALDGFLTDRKNPDGQSGADRVQQVHLAWQIRKGLTFDGRVTQEANSKWASLGDEREWMLRGLVARNLSLEAHRLSKTNGATGKTDAADDVKATVTMPRFAGMRNAQWMMTFADRIASDQLVSTARTLTFDAETRLNQFHFEYVGNTVTVGQQRNSLSSRALRIVSNQPKSWLQYSLYYKQRQQSLGPPLPDVRDYQVRMQIQKMSLLYHYLNQQECPNGTVADLVQTTFQLSGPLSKSLLWSAEFDQTGTAASQDGTRGLLLGVKGAVGPKQNLAVAYGRQELRANAARVHGDTYKLNYQAKTSDDDFLSFDGQLTTWDEKTPQTPEKAVASVQLDMKKMY